MASRWGRLLVAAAIVVAPPAAAQRVTELGLQATGTFSEPALAVAGAPERFACRSVVGSR